MATNLGRYTVADVLANPMDKTLGARLGDVRAKALVTVLAITQCHVGNEKFGHTISKVEAEALFYPLARTQ